MNAVRGISILRTLSRSIGVRLFVLLFSVLLLVLGILGYMNLRLHGRDLEQSTFRAAERVSDVLRRSTSYHMMRNDRAALYHTIQTMGSEPGMVRVRIVNPQGQISFSTDTAEVSQQLDPKAEGCEDCRVDSQRPTSRQFRIFEQNGERVLGVATPILNSPSCATAECHAHPIEQSVLGVLDTTISLNEPDQHLAASSRRMLMYSILAVVAISLISGLFVWGFVHRPVKALLGGTHHLTSGELGYQIPVHSDDQLGELADSFNEMSRQLAEAQDELTAWARTLEERVAAKSSELQRAHDQMVLAEKLTSLGKLAAVVAHEINNPLSAILTYAKLISRWVGRRDAMEEHEQEIRESLSLIAAESRRCGELVNSLLTFARVPPMNTGDIDINEVIQQALRLIEHKVELANISVHLELSPELPLVHGDSAQLEQVFLALAMNAIEAIGREGNLMIRTSIAADGQVVAEIRDDGCGIPEELMPRIFDPFLTTKEAGVGLGLAISRTIVDRHGGDISINSQQGQGTTFSIRLPAAVRTAVASPALLAVH